MADRQVCRFCRAPGSFRTPRSKVNFFFVAGAIFGEVQVSLFVAGAVLGEIWHDSRSAKCCNFQYKMLVASAKSNLGHEAGCGLTVSFFLGTVSDRPRIGNDVSSVFSKFL